jgi:hypothetical protein
VALGSLGATPTLALAASDVNVVATGTLTANATLTITGLTAGAAVRLVVTQDATGGRTLSVKVGSSTLAVNVSPAPNVTTVVDAMSPDGIDLYVNG